MFDADGARSCPDAEPGEFCGTPTAQDADANRAASDPDPLTFQVSVLEWPTLTGLSVGGVARQGSRRREMV